MTVIFIPSDERQIYKYNEYLKYEWSEIIDMYIFSVWM